MVEGDGDQGSILNDTKYALGMIPEYTPYDPVVIMHINATNTILWDLGIGPEEAPVVITGANDVWELFGEEIPLDQLSMIKSYMYLKVRIAFDPPTLGFLLTSMEKQIEEQEYRLKDRRESLIPRTEPESEVDPEWCL